jgi:hypothetical protein
MITIPRTLLAVLIAAIAGTLAVTPAAFSASLKSCPSTTSSGRLQAGPTMSCAFARSVERYINAHSVPSRVLLRSPVTHKLYTLVRTTPQSSSTGYRYASRTDSGLWLREIY